MSLPQRIDRRDIRGKPKPGIPNTEADFWALVQKTEDCWLWCGEQNGRGYGIFHFAGKPRRAHRLAYTFTYGEPPGELGVLHSCDYPACVNPAHLRLGTHQENMRDMALRGRAAKMWGESAPSAILTADQVREVRSSRETGRALARKFGVGPTTIYAIRSGRTWRKLA